MISNLPETDERPWTARYMDTPGEKMSRQKWKSQNKINGLAQITHIGAVMVILLSSPVNWYRSKQSETLMPIEIMSTLAHNRYSWWVCNASSFCTLAFVPRATSHQLSKLLMGKYSAKLFLVSQYVRWWVKDTWWWHKCFIRNTQAMIPRIPGCHSMISVVMSLFFTRIYGLFGLQFPRLSAQSKHKYRRSRNLIPQIIQLDTT